MNITLEIDNDGNVHGLYTDAINLFSLGQVTNVRKASNVEFNEKKQMWEVTSLSGVVLFSHKNREYAINWEIDNFSPGGKYYEHK